MKQLEPHADTIFLLVRKSSLKQARSAFSGSKKIHFIEGDILKNDVCAKVEDVAMLSQEVDHVLHLAAKYDLTMPVLEAYTHNVVGVQNVLALSRKLKNLEYFHHVSTYAVNGAKEGRVKEDDLRANIDFPDHYSKSKSQGEHLVRTMEVPGVKKRIYRPGIVIGDSRTGEIEKIDGPYYFFKFLHDLGKYQSLLEKVGVLPMPFGTKCVLPMIPVDILSEWLAQSILRPNESKELKCYHFIGDKQITLKKFIDMSLPAFGIRCTVKRLARHGVYKYLLPRIGMPKELMSYMFMEASFEVSQRRADFPQHKEYNMESIVKNLASGATARFQEGSL